MNRQDFNEGKDIEYPEVAFDNISLFNCYFIFFFFFVMEVEKVAVEKGYDHNLIHKNAELGTTT